MSKELEDLRDLKNAFIGHCKELKCGDDYVKVCENKFDKIIFSFERKEKLKKVWRIIKRNEYIDLEEVKKYSNHNDYNEQFREEYRLSKTEFNLIKEMLEEK